MPKFFFNLRGGAVPHSEGCELRDLAAAKEFAVRTACSLVSQNAAELIEQGEWQMSVTDSEGLVLFTLTFFTTDAPAVRTVTIGEPPATPDG